MAFSVSEPCDVIRVSDDIANSSNNSVLPHAGSSPFSIFAIARPTQNVCVIFFSDHMFICLRHPGQFLLCIFDDHLASNTILISR